MKNSEDEHVGIRQLVADLVVRYQHLPDLAGRELRHLHPEARVSGNALCASDQMPYGACRC